MKLLRWFSGIVLVLVSASVFVPQASATASASPTLTSPTSSTTYGANPLSMTFSYSFPSPPTAGTTYIKMVLNSDSTTYRIFHVSSVNGAKIWNNFNPLLAGSTYLVTNPADITSVDTFIANASSNLTMPSGVYTITLGWQDSVPNAESTTVATNVGLFDWCSPGKYSASGSTPCTAAPMGSYVALSHQTTPSSCPANTYTAVVGAMTCNNCPTGSTSSVGSSSCNTPSPTLTSPASGFTIDGSHQMFIVNYLIPFQPLGGSVTLMYISTTDNTTYRIIRLSDTYGTAVNFGFDTLARGSDLQSLIPNSVVTTYIGGSLNSGANMPTGVYTFRISWQDSIGSPPSSAMATNVTLNRLCDIGTFSVNGAQPCNPAPAGSYVANIGQSSVSSCADGSFQPNLGSSFCVPASQGHYAKADHTAELPCANGSYQPNQQSTSCIPADPGYYVDSIGAAAQVVCPTGTTSTAGASSCTALPTTTTTVPASTAVVTAVAKCAVKKGKSISVICLAKNAGITIAKGSTTKVASATTKVCAASGAVLKTTKTGTCKAKLTVTAKGGKPKTYSVSVIIN